MNLFTKQKLTDIEKFMVTKGESREGWDKLGGWDL